MVLARIKKINIGGLIGLLFFLGIFGFQIVQPTYIDWLLDNKNHDAIQHFVGWEFFRHEPWHFPLGLIQNYGYPIGTSIVYTDSIPIFALFFKCFANGLPSHFQYFGLWFGLCFFLQGFFAWQLSEHITPHYLSKLCITLFFLLSPIMLNRMIDHHALVAHWLLLAAILFYIQPYQSKLNYYWLGLIVLAVVIHAYFVPMLLIVWLAFLIKHILVTKQISPISALKFIFVMMMSVLIVAWQCGYFTYSSISTLTAGGYSFNALNLLALFRPTVGSMFNPDHWSALIPSFAPRFVEQGTEGFNYFGLGMVMLSVIGSVLLIKNFPTKLSLLMWTPLLLICALLVMYAISNTIYVGSYLLFSYAIPAKLIFITKLFRAAGRFFWPVYYVLMVVIFLILSKQLSPKLYLALLMLALTIQFMDLSPKLIESRHKLVAEHKNITFSLLNEMNNYKKIIFLPSVARPQVAIPHFGDVIHYAANHGLTVNLGYFAREDNGEYGRVGRRLLLEAHHGKYQSDAIYIIHDPQTMRTLKAKLPAHKKLAIGRSNVILPIS